MAYFEVQLSKINPEVSLPVDIYLCLNQKYIKYKNAGEAIETHKYNDFILKGIKVLYIDQSDKTDLFVWLAEENNKKIEKLVNQAGEDNREIIVDTQKLKEIVYDVFTDEELNHEKVEALQNNVQDFVKKMRSNHHFPMAISSLAGDSDSIASHSIAVANLSIFIAMALGHGNQFTLENLYLASIFHDYGKLKIPDSVLKNPDHPDSLKFTHSHPNDSVQVIRKSEGIPEQVIKMIQEHHEYWDGSGYPKGLKQEELYKHSPILCLANELERFLTNHKDLPKNKIYKRAIDLVQDGGAVKWPPSFYPRVIEALELSFKVQDN